MSFSGKVVLVTGSTTGIGEACAKVFAESGAAVMVSGRSEERGRKVVEAIRRAGGRAELVAVDLRAAGACDRLVSDTIDRLGGLDVLVNNAGFGISGAFVETDLQREVEMIQLNVVSLVILTKLFAREMAQKGHGKILNVASTAAFQPGPFMAIYYATKAFVLSFSEGLAEELNDSGVTVTALCPGPTATQFSKRAELEKSRLFQGGIIPVLDPATVAKMGYDGLSKGQRIVIPGLMNKIGVLALRFIPRRLVTQITKQFNR